MFVHNNVTSDSRVLKEASSLAAQGWNLRFIGLVVDGSEWPQTETVNDFTIIRVAPRLLRRTMPGTFGKLLRLIMGIPRVIRELRSANARVYHAHDFIGLLMMALAGIRKPIVYDSHELFFDRWSPESRYPLKHLIQLMRPLEKLLARRAVAVITASEESADWMMKTLAIPRPIALLNTVDVRRLGPQAATYDTGNRKKVVHSGGLYNNRHLEELIASLAYLPDDVALILMGAGPLKQSLLRQAAELGINDRLLIVPPVPPDSVAPTLAQADASVVLVASQPLHYDLTMANKFFESVTAGLPIVCSPTTAAARVMREYNLGILCDPSNPTLIADAIARILQPENQQLYRANVQQAQNIFTWETEERKLVALYKHLLG